MSLYSSSTLSSGEESNNSYYLSSSSSSITTVSNPSSNQQRWPVQETYWRIEKNISLKDQRSLGNTCILRATMTKDHILIQPPTIVIPGKHISMKVAFKY